MTDNPKEEQKNASVGDDGNQKTASNDWGAEPDQSGWIVNATSNWNDPDAPQDTSGWEMPASTVVWGEQPSGGDGWLAEDDSAVDGPVIKNGSLFDTKKRKEGGGGGRGGGGRGRGRGGYVPTAPAPRERMDEEALEERMAKIRAQNEKIRERREQIKADEEAFQALMIEERAKQARARKLQAQIDQTRELNAQRKMDKIKNREWDVVKQDGDWKQKRVWDVGKKDGDQQEKEGDQEQVEAPGKGFPLSRLEETKLEMQKLGISPNSTSKSKLQKKKKKDTTNDEEEGAADNTGDNEDWGTTNAALDDSNDWGNANNNSSENWAVDTGNVESWGTGANWAVPEEGQQV